MKNEIGHDEVRRWRTWCTEYGTWMKKMTRAILGKGQPCKTPEHPVYGKAITLGVVADIPPNCGVCPGLGGLEVVDEEAGIVSEPYCKWVATMAPLREANLMEYKPVWCPLVVDIPKICGECPYCTPEPLQSGKLCGYACNRVYSRPFVGDPMALSAWCPLQGKALSVDDMAFFQAAKMR